MADLKKNDNIYLFFNFQISQRSQLHWLKFGPPKIYSGGNFLIPVQNIKSSQKFKYFDTGWSLFVFITDGLINVLSTVALLLTTFYFCVCPSRGGKIYLELLWLWLVVKWLRTAPRCVQSVVLMCNDCLICCICSWFGV